MIDYTGIKCPVCEIPFKADDDIVVCPECGAPYHRECYNSKGECIFHDLHEKDEDWQAPVPPVSQNVTAEIKDIECPICGTLNSKSAQYCNRCGYSLTGEHMGDPNMPQTSFTDNQQVPPNQPSNQQYNQAPQGQQPFQAPMSPFVFDPMGGVSPVEELDDDVNFGEVSKFVKQGTNYYMPVFKYMKTTKKNKFNFSAFLFSGIWYLYRKQYKLGAIITSIMFALFAARTLVSIFVFAPTYAEVLNLAGIEMDTVSLFLSTAEYKAISTVLMDNPMMYLKIALPTIIMVVDIIIRIIIGMNANKNYMKHVTKSIRRIKSTESVSAISAVIDAKGGTNMALATSIALCFMILRWLPMYL